MPIRPTFLERLVFYRLNRAPAPILDLFAAAGFRATTLAIETGVFEALEAGDRTPAAVAETVDADPESVRHLLQFLEPLGYVRRSDDGYAPTAMTRTWLLGEDPNVAPWLTYWNDQIFNYWDEHLETAFREGEPPETVYDWLDDEGWEQTQRGFRAVATMVADSVFGAISLPDGAARLLDVGGGHGYYSIEACHRQPELSATILDDPDALALAREEIATAGMGDRITCLGGDALTDDFGDDYDVIFCFNVVHGYGPSVNRRLLTRLRQALASGGKLVVLDQFQSRPRFSTARAGLGLTGFVYATALGATVYEAETIESWLRDTGFSDVETTEFRTYPGMGVVVGRPD